MTNHQRENVILSNVSHCPKDPEVKQSFNRQNQFQIPQNFWTETQHILYILFLQKNRDKAKSKLIRRSNSFFESMSIFIDSKTALQCRGHHKKYQFRHKFPHRIVKEEKKKLDMPLYIKLSMESMSVTQDKKVKEKVKIEEIEKESTKVENAQIGCQTDFEGVRNPLFMLSNVEHSYSSVHPAYFHSFPFYNYQNSPEHLYNFPHF